MANKLWMGVSVALLVLGLIFFAVMAAMGSATDVGVYSVTAVLVGFGLAGLWASRTSGVPERV